VKGSFEKYTRMNENYFARHIREHSSPVILSGGHEPEFSLPIHSPRNRILPETTKLELVKHLILDSLSRIQSNLGEIRGIILKGDVNKEHLVQYVRLIKEVKKQLVLVKESAQVQTNHSYNPPPASDDILTHTKNVLFCEIDLQCLIVNDIKTVAAKLTSANSLVKIGQLTRGVKETLSEGMKGISVDR